MSDDPLEDRQCGECTVCCTVLTVDTPELQKLSGYTCSNCVVGQGCGIYHTRPPICRTWFCGWRQLGWVSEALRPDRSDVLISLVEDGLPEEYDIGLKFTLLAEPDIAADGLVEAVATSIRNDFATFVLVQGPPGQLGTRVLVNEMFKDNVATGDMSVMLADIKRLYLSLRFAIRANELSPIILTDYTAQKSRGSDAVSRGK